jgi:hypothetical protein
MQQFDAAVVLPRTMKRRTMLFPLALAVVGVLAGCTTSPLSRIDRDRAKYESWPIEVQEAVLNGVARKGMTAEQVEMAMGKPTEVVARGKAGEDEVWVYRKSSVGSGLLNNSGVSIGGGLGGVNVGTGMGGRRASSNDESEVVFSNGKVVRSDTDR